MATPCAQKKPKIVSDKLSLVLDISKANLATTVPQYNAQNYFHESCISEPFTSIIDDFMYNEFHEIKINEQDLVF